MQLSFDASLQTCLLLDCLHAAHLVCSPSGSAIGSRYNNNSSRVRSAGPHISSQGCRPTHGQLHHNWEAVVEGAAAHPHNRGNQ